MDQIASLGIRVDTGGVDGGIRSLDAFAATGPKVEASMDKVSQSATKTGKSIANLGQNTGPGLANVGRQAEQAAVGITKAGDAAEEAKVSLADLGKSLIGFVSVREFVRAADAVTVLQNQLKLATGSAQAAASAYSALFEIAQRSRVNFAELGSTFASITRASESLKLSQQEILTLTETVANAITVSGSSAAASQAALVQLGQGLASGVLRGEELNSILEQTPRLAKALADGLGVSVGALRNLGSEGKLTAEAVIGALRSQSTALAREVSESTATVGQSFTLLQNASTVLVGEIDRVIGVSSLLSTSLAAVSASIGDVSDALRQSSDSGADFELVGSAISTVFETVAVLGANLAYMLVGIGKELGGLAAQAAAIAQGQFAEAGAIRAAMVADAEAARVEIDKLSERILSARKLREQAQAELKALDTRAEDARLGRQAGNSIAALDFSKLIAGADKAKKSVKALGDEFAAQRSAAKDWADAFGDFQKIQRDAEASTLGLSRGQARLLEYLQSPGYASASDSMREIALQGAYAAIAAEQLAAGTKDASKAAEEAAEAHAKYLAELEKGGDEVAKQVLRLREEEEALTISAAKNISLAQALEHVAIARLQEQQAAMMGAGNQAGIDAIQREIDKRRELIGLMGNKESRDASKKAIDDTEREAERMARSIEQTLTDSLMRGFESGKGFAETLKGSVEAMFKTMVLRPTIEAAAKQLSGGTDGAKAIASWLPYLDAAASASAGKWGTSAGTAFGAYIGGPLGAVVGKSLGSAVDKIFSGGAGTPHMGAMYLSNGAYGYVPGERVVGDMAYGDSVYKNRSSQVEDYLKGVTTGSAAALNSIAKNFGNLGGFQVGGYFAADNKDASQGNIKILQGGTAVSTISAKYSANGEQGLKEYTNQLSAEVKKALTDIGLPDWAKGMLDKIGEAPALDQLAATVDQINATQKALGDLDSAFAPLGGIFAKVASLSGEATMSLAGFVGGLGGLDQLTRSYYDAFYTEGEKAAATTKMVTEALGGLGYGMPATREAFRAIVDAQDLTTEAGRKNAAELLKLAPAFAQVTAETVALTGATDNSAKALAAAAQKAAEAGRETLAGLAGDRGSLEVELLRAQGKAAAASALELQQTLLRLTEGLTATDAAAVTASQAYNDGLRAQIEAAQAASEAQRAAAEQAKAVESQRYGIEGQLLQLQGNTAALRARELAALDPANRALQERVFALQDEQAAATLAAQAAQAAAQAQAQAAADAERARQAAEQQAKAVADQRFGLEGQILQLQGDTAALRARELAALDPANRALQERINAIKDEQTATQIAAQAAQELVRVQEQAAAAEAQKAQAIAAQRSGLEGQLLQLQGNTAEIRARELAALDASNRSIQERIYALQDEQAAAQVAAKAKADAESDAERIRQAAQQKAQATADQKFGLEGQLLQLQGDTAAIRAREIAALDEANRYILERIFALKDEQEAAQAAAQAAKDAAAAQEQAAAEAARQAEAIASQRFGLEGQILQLQGDTAALRARELAALDPSNRALQERIYAIQAEQTAAQAAAQAVKDAAAAREQEAAAAAQKAQAIASQRFGLESELLQLQGDTAALRARELESLDASNRALKERIYALQDEQAAKVLADQAIAKASEEAAAKLKALADVMSNLGGTRFDLENQLLSLQGNGAEVLRRTRERDLAELTRGLSAGDAAKVTAAYDLNESLRRQIEGTTAAQKAAEALAQAQASAAEEANRAAEQIRSAWQSVTDSIFDEVARIRGLITGDSGSSFADLQAQFAVKSAQAKAGDQEAAKMLPGLSQSILNLAEAQATSLIELQRIRAQTAASLSSTGGALAAQIGLNVPRLASGTSYAPDDMLAVIQRGDAVVPAAFNPEAGGANVNAELVAEVRAMRAELVELRKRADAGNANTARAAAALEGDQKTPLLVEIA